MKKLHLSLLIFLILSSTSLCQEINEIIQPINFTASEKKTFLISDLFYSDKEYRVTFDPDSSLKVFYEAENGFVDITSLKDSEGYGVLPFYFYDKTYHILYKTEFRETIFFSFKPWKPVERVNLFGSFNGWNRENLPMTDEDGAGLYSIGIPLEPGRYEYKFYVDLPDGKAGGEEIIDSLNSEVIPNGLGGWNSVLVVKPLHTGKTYLHILDYSYKKTNTLFSFYYESETTNDIEVIALLDNELIPENVIGMKERKIFIDIPSEKLKGDKTLRVAVNENGRASNLQTIMLIDGKLLSDENSTWHDAIIYSIMVDRFSDGDSSNSIPVEYPEIDVKANYQGGDLQGIIDKLEEGYFDSLGINIFWLSPVIDNTPNAYKEYPPPYKFYTGYHGYWPVHLTKVEEHFGDMDLLKMLIDKAHQHGIKVLLDFVSHHVHIEHPFWKEHREWFGTLDLPDGRKNLRLWDEYRLTTWFEPYMPSFDFEGSKEAMEVMTDNAVWWLKETGADGFRHDAVKHVPNQFWRTLTKKIKKELEIPQKKIYYQIGETFGSYELVSSYVNNGQLNAQFNFILYDTAIPTFIDENTSFTALDQQMQKTFNVYGVNNLMGNVIDSHDKTRFMSYADSDVSLTESNAIEIGWNNPPEVDDPENYNKLKLYLAYMMTIPGVPVIYYGDEIGMTGAGDPDNRRMMRFGNSVTEDEQKVLDDVKKIINARNSHSALRYGDFQTLLVNENCYAYLRSDLNERILVVLNKSNQEEKPDITLPGIYNLQKAIDVISKKEFRITDNKLSVDINGMTYLVLKLE
ncbi:MAG: alpha-amylase family glycosyl hydrolase [Ignavibacteria bacterium]|nr:alpha-amylase family glycosyl hydrolase [Ignavibacteria bacterium]